MYNNGFYNGQAAGSSQSHYQTQNNSNPSQVMRHPFTLTAADALRARQIMLEDQQRLVAEQLAMEEAKEREAARLFAEAALLEDQIASAEASRVRLDAIKQQLGIPNRPMLTYEPTPATTQIVPVEEDQGSHGSSPMHQQNATNFTQNQSQQNAYTAQLRALQAAQQQQIQQSQQYASAQRAQTHAFQPGSQSYQQMHSSQQQRPNPYPPTHSSAQPLQYNHPSSGATQQQSVQRPQFPLPSNIQTSVQSPPSFSSLTATGVTQRQPQAQAVPQSQNNQRVQSLQATSQQASSNAQRSSSAQQSSHMAAAPSAVMNVPQSQSQYHTTQHPERQTTATTMNSNPQLTSADTERLKALHHHAGVWAKQAKPGKMERIRGTHLFVRSEPNQGYTVGFMGENGFVAITVDQAIQPLREINFLPPSVAAATTPTNVPAQPSPTIPSTTATGAAAQVNAMRTTNIPPNSSSAVAPNTYPPNTYPHTPHMTVNPKVLDLHPHASSSPKPQSLIVLNDAPSTPTNKKTDSNARPSPRTPAEANKKSLARDLLRALGPPSQKRRRESESDDRAAKRQALVDITVAQAAQSTINASAAAIQTPVLNYQVPGQPIPAPTALQPPARTLTAGGVTNVQSGIKAAGVESSGSALSAQPLQSTASVGNTPSAINPALVLQSPDPTKQSTTTSSENPVSPNKKGFAVNSSPFKVPTPKQIPLFLPASPSPSPVIDEEAILIDILDPAESDTVRDSDGEVVDDPKSAGKSDNRKIRTAGTKRMVMDYVEIPTPAWLKRDRLRRMNKGNVRQIQEVIEIDSDDDETQSQKEKAKASRRSQSSRTTIGEESHSSRSTPVRDLQELAVLNQSITRLQRSVCKWGGCEIALNSAEKLARHLRIHMAESQQAMGRHGGSILCKLCGRHVNEAKVSNHIESHVFNILYCPYQECQESFRSSHKLLQHTINDHHDDETLRPSADPFIPSTVPSPPDTPRSLPSYMVVARAVTPHPISNERHQVLGPWALKNMMPLVDTVSLKRYLKAKHLGRVEIPNTSDEYDFLMTRSSNSCMPSRPAKIRDLGDLNSSQLSQLITDGMTLSLWGKETAPSKRLSSLPAPPVGSSSSSHKDRALTDELLLSNKTQEQEIDIEN